MKLTRLPSLRHLLFPCFTCSGTPPTTTTTTKKRISTSLRDDIDIISSTGAKPDNCPSLSPCSSPSSPESVVSHAPPRPSKSMVICTFFGPRRGSHVWFCVQIDRLSSKPALLLELSLSTHNLVKEMTSGLVRIALECNRSDLGSCPLHSVPVWTMYCNGRRIGFAARRKAREETKLMLKKMQNMTVGAGVIPSEKSPERSEVMYMRANYEWVIGGADSESFHLISPDECAGHELSVFLLRSR